MGAAAPLGNSIGTASIGLLSEQLQRNAPDSWACIAADIEQQQRIISGKNLALRREEQRHDELVAKRSWARSELSGLLRSLGILSEVADARAGDIGPRLTRRLDILRLTAIYLEVDIAESERCIEELRRQVATRRAEAVTRLQERLDGAERKRRVAASKSGGNAMWSPFPIIGFRVWRVRTTGLQGGWIQWTSARQTASCEVAGPVPHTDGSCAKVAFGCGIYAMKSIERLTAGTVRGTPLVFGAATLAGTVVEHEHGYRAEHVTVQALAILSRDEVRFIHEANEVDEMFASPAAAYRLGYIAGPPQDRLRNLRAICNYLNNETRRLSSWI